MLLYLPALAAIHFAAGSALGALSVFAARGVCASVPRRRR